MGQITRDLAPHWKRRQAISRMFMLFSAVYIYSKFP